MGRDLPRLLRAGRRRAAHEAAEVLRRIDELSQEHGLRVGNVFHAGDGNLHPLVLYDGRVEGEAERAEALAQQILEICIDAGGSITGEHGVGTDKACAMPLMFGEDDLAAMQRLRRAFDPPGSRTPASSSRRRACAARCRGRIAPTSAHPSRGARACRRGASDGGKKKKKKSGRILEHEPGDLT